jgi:uroporphyrinogen III methyltransferase/synthase
MNDLNSSAPFPLSGKTIVVTRAKKQAKEFAVLLENLGARVIQFPAVEFSGPEDWSECDAIVSSLSRYSGVIFTSVNAVEYFCRRAADRSVVSQLKDLRIYTVGEITRCAAEEYGMRAEKLLETHTAERLAHEIVRTIPSGSRLIFPKGNLGGEELISIVSAAGIIVDSVTVYRTLEPVFNDERKAIVSVIESTADMLTFFSPSSVTNVLHHLSAECVHRIPAAVIGETTAEAARRAGIQVVLVAPQSAADPFAKAIGQFYSH